MKMTFNSTHNKVELVYENAQELQAILAFATPLITYTENSEPIISTRISDGFNFT